MSEAEPTSDVAALTVQLLSAYLSNNTVPSENLAELIRSTREALSAEATGNAAAEPAETFTPAVSVRKSLANSSHIVSLIDGRPYKTLKRHLAANGLTPETYRSRYGLPASYPMVAPDYAEQRRAVAQRVGLGSRKPAADPVEEDAAPLASTTAAEPEAPAATLPERTTVELEKPKSKPSRRAKTAPPGAELASDVESSGAQEEAKPTPETADRSPDNDDKKAKPRKSAGSSKPANAKPRKKAEAATSQPDTESASTAGDAAAEPQPAPAASKPRRRRADSEPSDAPAAGEAQAPDANDPSEAPARRGKPKRMARSSAQ